MPTQLFFNQAVLDNYRDAANAWAFAENNVGDFDGQLDGATQQFGWNAGANQALQTLAANALIKSNRAAGTMAGEAFETHSWGVNGHQIDGPGGGAGIDIRRFQPGINTVSARHAIEVKSARTRGSLLDGIANAIAVQNATEIRAYYTGDDQDGDLGAVFNFVRGGVQYWQVGAQGNYANLARVNIFDNQGVPIAHFGINW